jgi:hypothetical protein
MNRRQLIRLSVLLFALAWAGTAFAGSYLHRASVLLHGAELEGKSISRRFHDKELAQVLHRVAIARAQTANEMLVPDEVKRAHPHLLLVLESYERATDAASRGAHTEFLVALSRAREEAAIFTAVLKQSGWTLPD